MNRCSKIRSNSGFTLIELLIAIAISGIVLAGLVQVLSTSNRSYTQQDEMVILQQNLRSAKMNLERDVRMAGCGLGSAFFYLGNQIYPIQNTNGGSNGSDTLTIQYVNYGDPCNGALPHLTVTGISSPPAFTVSEDLTTSWNTVVPCRSTFPFFAVYTRSTTDDVTKLISDVFEVTDIPLSNTLKCKMGSDGAWRANFSTIVPRSGSTNSINFFSATQLITITYSLSTDRVLIRNEQPANIVGPIAEDIEDLQFAFGLDTNVPPDGIVDSWVTNRNLDSTTVPAEQTQVRQVRISIFGRSSHQLPGQSADNPDGSPNIRPQIEDHETDGSVKDRFLRQLLQFEITPRNLK